MFFLRSLLLGKENATFGLPVVLHSYCAIPRKPFTAKYKMEVEGESTQEQQMM